MYAWLPLAEGQAFLCIKQLKYFRFKKHGQLASCEDHKNIRENMFLFCGKMGKDEVIFL